MRTAGMICSMVWVVGCVSPRVEDRHRQLATFEGSPEVRVRTDGELKRSDLARGLPALRIECPANFPLSVSIVDDVDGDAQPSVGERRSLLRAVPIEGGFGLDPASFREETCADFVRPLLVVEFKQADGAQMYSRLIE